MLSRLPVAGFNFSLGGRNGRPRLGCRGRPPTTTHFPLRSIGGGAFLRTDPHRPTKEATCRTCVRTDCTNSEDPPTSVTVAAGASAVVGRHSPAICVIAVQRDAAYAISKR